MNANLVPLGGKSSLGQSPVVAAELARLKSFRDELLAVGPVNSNERALATRRALLRNQPALASVFAELKLSL